MQDLAAYIRDLSIPVYTDALGSNARLFFEAEAFDFYGLIRHAERLDGLTVTQHSTDPSWSICFHFRGYRFLIDTCADSSSFVVSDSECSDKILLEVLSHFHSFAPLLYCEADPRCHPYPLLNSWITYFIAFAIALCIVFALIFSKRP